MNTTTAKPKERKSATLKMHTTPDTMRRLRLLASKENRTMTNLMETLIAKELTLKGVK